MSTVRGEKEWEWGVCLGGQEKEEAISTGLGY